MPFEVFYFPNRRNRTKLTHGNLIRNATETKKNESATTQIAVASKNFGMIFGSNLENVMDILISKYAEQLKSIRVALETLYSNFDSILIFEIKSFDDSYFFLNQNDDQE